MAIVGRRSFLGFLAAIGVVGSGDGAWAQASLPSYVVSRRRAIIALRLLNTAQGRHSGRYRTLAQIVATSPSRLAAINVKAGFDVFDVDALAGGRDFIPGFQLVSHISADASGYSYLLVGRHDARSYRTDERGVIYEGNLQVGAALAKADMINRPFVGAPLEMKEVARPAFGRVGAAVAAASSFFFPVVSAQTGQYCCNQVCFSSCHSGSGSQICGQVCECETESKMCCNTGFPTCSWCCVGCGGGCDDWQCCDCLMNCF